jgi:DNA invertase Pin-like site-specific DNA recombinase
VPTVSGVAKVFRETASRAQTDRAQLRRPLGQLAAEDVLMVTGLDRLARSIRDLPNALATVVDRGAGFRSLDGGRADTTTPHGRLVRNVLGGLAEFERELIRTQTGEDGARAVAHDPHAPAATNAIDQQADIAMTHTCDHRRTRPEDSSVFKVDYRCGCCIHGVGI